MLFAFAQLNCSEIRLRRLCQRSGLLGFDKVVSYALNEWASDIKKKQIPGNLVIITIASQLFFTNISNTKTLFLNRNPWRCWSNSFICSVSSRSERSVLVTS